MFSDDGPRTTKKESSMLNSRRHILALTFACALPLLASTPAAGGEPRDHLLCMSDSDLTSPNLKATADLTPAQNPPFSIQNCKLRLRASNVCTPTFKTNVRDRNGEPVQTFPIATAGDTRPYACYLLRCPTESPKGSGLELEVEDQLGRRKIQIKRADFFCQPAVLNPNT
jgi:hypothetical protein